jgi:hypothetical protein
MTLGPMNCITSLAGNGNSNGQMNDRWMGRKKIKRKEEGGRKCANAIGKNGREREVHQSESLEWMGENVVSRKVVFLRRG